MGILAGSLIAAIIGYVILVLVTRKPAGSPDTDEQHIGTDPG